MPAVKVPTETEGDKKGRRQGWKTLLAALDYSKEKRLFIPNDSGDSVDPVPPSPEEVFKALSKYILRNVYMGCLQLLLFFFFFFSSAQQKCASFQSLLT